MHVLAINMSNTVDMIHDVCERVIVTSASPKASPNVDALPLVTATIGYSL